MQRRKATGVKLPNLIAVALIAFLLGESIPAFAGYGGFHGYSPDTVISLGPGSGFDPGPPLVPNFDPMRRPRPNPEGCATLIDIPSPPQKPEPPDVLTLPSVFQPRFR